MYILMKVLLLQTVCMPAFAGVLIMKPKETQASLLIHLIKKRKKVK